jgi:TRAP-type C4-dicarboxylate transport system substrate-binding protein
MADVTDHVSLWPVSSSYGGVIIANMDAWNELPADLQGILMDVSLEMQGQNIYATDVDLRRAISGIRASGLNVITPDSSEIEAAISITQPVIDRWLEISGPLAPELLEIISEYGSGAIK